MASRYAKEVGGNRLMSFGEAIAHEFHADIAGFEPFELGTTDQDIFQDAVRMRLTQRLGKW